MTRTVSWPDEYAALIGRLPDLVDQSRLTVGGFSACVDVYLSFHETRSQLDAARTRRAEGAAMLAELERRALNGIGGELLVDWPDGPGWIDRHVSGRKAIGGTSVQAAYMLAHLGAPALVALEDRSAGQLAVLHPDTLVATDAGVAPDPPSRPKAPGARRTTSSNSPPAKVSEPIGCRARREPSSASTTTGCSTIPRSCASLLQMPATPALGSSVASTRCRRSAPRRSSTMPPASPLHGGRRSVDCPSGTRRLSERCAPRPDDRAADAGVTSVGMSLSELADLYGESESAGADAIRLAEALWT